MAGTGDNVLVVEGHALSGPLPGLPIQAEVELVIPHEATAQGCRQHHVDLP